MAETKHESEKIVIEAPTSFTGATKRLWKLVEDKHWAVQIIFGIIIFPVVYSFILIWYFVIYVLFGIFVIPFRLFTRGGRKRKLEAARHREMMQAIQKNK